MCPTFAIVSLLQFQDLHNKIFIITIAIVIVTDITIICGKEEKALHKTPKMKALISKNSCVGEYIIPPTAWL